MKSLNTYINESIENLSYILKDIIYDEDFLEDNYGVFKGCNSDRKKRLKLIDGYCIEVCLYISSYYEFENIDYYLLDDGGESYHFIMKYNKQYYDAYNYNGVKNLSELKFVELYMKQYNEEELNKHLKLISKNDFDYNKAIKIKNENTKHIYN